MYSAIRTSLLNTDVFYKDAHFASIAFNDGMWVWMAENSPLSSFAGGRQSCPALMIDGTRFEARKALKSNRFLVNDYKVWLVAQDGNVPISSFMPASWPKEIEFKGQKYCLKRQSIFAFKFTLEGENTNIIFRETTPFFTFSSRKSFSITSADKVDPILLTFSLFLAMSVTYR